MIGLAKQLLPQEVTNIVERFLGRVKETDAEKVSVNGIDTFWLVGTNLGAWPAGCASNIPAPIKSVIWSDMAKPLLSLPTTNARRETNAHRTTTAA